MRPLTIALLVWFGTAFAADDELPIPADEFVYCTVCHGVQLMGNPITKAPRLSGMEQWYVERQLEAYKKGLRGRHEGDILGYEMQPMAAALDDAQIREAAEFVAAARSPAPAATVKGDVVSGKAQYSTCAACHGVNAEGNEALGAPDLRTPDDWYQVTQLRNFKSGSRGGNPGDIYGMQMRAAAQLLSDDQSILDVVSYINTLQGK